MVICRSLAVLLFAPFIQQGQALLEEIAGVLGRPASDPAELIVSYAEAVRRSDIPTVERCVERRETAVRKVRSSEAVRLTPRA